MGTLLMSLYMDIVTFLESRCLLIGSIHFFKNGWIPSHLISVWSFFTMRRGGPAKKYRRDIFGHLIGQWVPEADRKLRPHLERALGEFMSKFEGLPKMSFPTDVSLARFNPDASPSVPYGPGLKKSDVETSAKLEAHLHHLQSLLNGEWCRYQITKSSGRGASRSKILDRKIKVGQLVWGVHFVTRLISGLTTQQATQWFTRGAWGLWDCSWYVSLLWRCLWPLQCVTWPWEVFKFRYVAVWHFHSAWVYLLLY